MLLHSQCVLLCIYEEIWRNKNRLFLCHLMMTCLGLCMVSWVVAMAAMARLLPGLSCSDSERPDTSCTLRSVMLTLSSSTCTVLSPRTKSDRGDITWVTGNKNMDEKGLGFFIFFLYLLWLHNNDLNGNYTYFTEFFSQLWNLILSCYQLKSKEPRLFFYIIHFTAYPFPIILNVS